jgi:hypothetical protein
MGVVDEVLLRGLWAADCAGIEKRNSANAEGSKPTSARAFVHLSLKERKMLSSQEEQHERRAVQANDARVKEQSRTGTFMSHAQADAEIPGRFAAISNAFVVGSKPDIAGAYPAASFAHQTQLPDEEPLGFDNPALEPLAHAPSSQGQLGEPDVPPLAGAPLPNPAPAFGGIGRGAGLGLSRDPAGVSFPSPPVTSRDVSAGSHPTFRRRV